MSNPLLITSALPYANGPLHFGHIAGAYLPGDCYARFQRLMGTEVLYLCGSDEYGVAITLSAELLGRTPKEQVDLFHEEHKALFSKLQFSFDYFGRTTSSQHQKTTKYFFEALKKQGYLFEKTEDHLYSEEEGRYLADRYVSGTCPKCGFEEARGDECQRCAASYEAIDLKNPRSKLTGSSLSLKPSTHLYLRFDRFQEKLSDWIGEKPWKESVLAFAKYYIDDLRPRAITRDSSWGIPVPGYPGKVFYVWFDAPIGYVSMTQEWAKKKGKPADWERFWLNPEATLVHFIGKDNIPFHAVFFPAMLMGQEDVYKLPDQIPANEFFLLEGKPFSKSDGWMIDLESFFTRYTSDQARYALAANAPETSDAAFSWKDFQMRCNAELLGKLGNFVHRTLTFAAKHTENKMPPASVLEEVDQRFLENLNLLTEQAAVCYRNFQLRKVTQTLMELAQVANTYFDAEKPWKLSKDPDLKPRLNTVMALCLECIQRLALIASPLIPTSAQKIWELLGFTSQLEKASWEQIVKTPLPVGQIFLTSTPLFCKVEDATIEEEIAKLGSMSAPSSSYPPLKESIAFEDFEKLDLRTAKILQAEPVPKSKKLLKIKVDLGFEKRTIVSGIAAHYQPEELVGKTVLVVANLKPAKLMGIESQGMILAASLDQDLELPTSKALPGSTVT